MPSPASRAWSLLSPALHAPGHQWGSGRQTLGKADCGARPLVATWESRSFPPHWPSLFQPKLGSLVSTTPSKAHPHPQPIPELLASLLPGTLWSLEPEAPYPQLPLQQPLLCPPSCGQCRHHILQKGRKTIQGTCGWGPGPHLLAPEEAQGQMGGKCLDTARKLGRGLVLCSTGCLSGG